MATKVTISGVSRRTADGQYAEYDFSYTVDDDLLPEEVVEMALRLAGENRIYRRASQTDDRIQVSYVGVQTGEALLRRQGRNAKGQLESYADVGERLWILKHPVGTQPTYGGSSEQNFERYAKEQGVKFVTGAKAVEYTTGYANLEKETARKLQSPTWRKEQTSASWRKTALRKVASPYKQMSLAGEYE